MSLSFPPIDQLAKMSWIINIAGEDTSGKRGKLYRTADVVECRAGCGRNWALPLIHADHTD